MMWCWCIAGNRGLDAVHSGSGGPNRCRGNRAWLRNLRKAWPIT